MMIPEEDAAKKEIVYNILLQVCSVASKTVKPFAYLTFDDLYQEAFIIGDEIIKQSWPKFVSISDEKYIFRLLLVSIKNRLINMYRSKVYRAPQFKCECHLCTNPLATDEEKLKCPTFERWFYFSQNKKILSGDVQGDTIQGDTLFDENLEERLFVFEYNGREYKLSKEEYNEFISLLKEHVPMNMRLDLLKLFDGVSISEKVHEKIRVLAAEIIEIIQSPTT